MILLRAPDGQVGRRSPHPLQVPDQLGVRCHAAVVRETRIDHFVAILVQQAVDPTDRVLGGSSRPVSVSSSGLLWVVDEFRR